MSEKPEKSERLTKEGRLERLRHSLAHVLAQAVERVRPGAQLGFGPPTDDGFYYDFILPEPLRDEDLPALEKAMRQIIGEKQQFAQEEIPLAEALARLGTMGQKLKVEYAKELAAKENLSTLGFYTNGPFVDMCRGPHVGSTQEIPPDCFKLTHISGAYWRGDERNAQMARITGWAFENKKALAAYEDARKLALERDHRKLGQELDLFVIDDDIGKGLPMWLPNGSVLCDELEKLAGEWEFLEGYHTVRTPHLAKAKLYETSGHLALYKESMFPPMHGDDEEFYLKPMNCPHHHKIYAARPRSYRELPLRLAEYGQVYRYERSGQLQGLSRVRGFAMNDAHIYLTEGQIRDEFRRLLDLQRRYFELFDLKDTYFRLSLWDPSDPKGKQKYVDDPPAWAKTEAIVREVLVESGLPFVEAIGEAAFYGPKIDIQFKTVALREFTASTIQLDFASPIRFDLNYHDSDGTEKRPYIIHRAPLGTHERFIAYLIEHYGGAFPTWLAPVQVKVLPLSENFQDYAEEIVRRLRTQMVRAEADRTSDPLGAKIRAGSIKKIPILLVVGEKEQNERTVTIRRYGIKEQRAMPLEAFEAAVQEEIRTRRHIREWSDIEKAAVPPPTVL